MVDNEGAPLNISETARVAPLEGEMADEPIPDLEHSVDEFALHDTFAHILQALADKYGVQVRTIDVTWMDASTIEQPTWRVKDIDIQSTKRL